MSPGWWVRERVGRGFLPLPLSSISASTSSSVFKFFIYWRTVQGFVGEKGKADTKNKCENTAVVCLSELLCALLLVLLLSEGGT